MVIYYTQTIHYPSESITDIFIYILIFNIILYFKPYIIFKISYFISVHWFQKLLWYFDVCILCNAPPWRRPHEWPKHVGGIECAIYFHILTRICWFWETCCHHPYRRRATLLTWRWRGNAPLKCWYQSTKLYGVISQKALIWKSQFLLGQKFYIFSIKVCFLLSQYWW
jgi:hypothetical protein